MRRARSAFGSRTWWWSSRARLPGGERAMLGFETLTLAPIDLALVEPKLMDADEIAWLDAYHARVRKTLSPLVDAPTRRWLSKRRGAWAQGAAGAVAKGRQRFGRLTASRTAASPRR